MYLELFSNLTVAANTTVYSQPFEIGDDNALYAQVYVSAGTGTITVTLEASNDMQNWATAQYSSGTISAGGTPPEVKGSNYTALAARYLRFKIVEGTTTNSITIGLSVNSARL